MFKWIFRKQIAALLQQHDSLDGEISRAREAVAIIEAAKATIEGHYARAASHEVIVNTLLDDAKSLVNLITTQLTGFHAQYNLLHTDSADKIADLTAKLDAHIADLDAKFGELIANRVKAEVGKWVFVGGAGGTLAAIQYCALCARGVQKWRMVPDQGPICEECCVTVLAAE